MFGKARIGMLAKFAFVVLTLPFVVPAQVGKIPNTTWEDVLFAKDVDYGQFACQDQRRQEVRNFFQLYPLKRIIGVCHNNCAILESFSKDPWPRLDKRLLGQGYIAAHVLTDTSGVPIYARTVNGHPAIASVVRSRACKASFRPSETNRQRLMILCITEKCDEPQPVYANPSL